MNTTIATRFTRKCDAQRALTNVRKACRIALRGAVVLGPDCFGTYQISAPLGGTGFSAAELAAELHARRDES